MPYVDPEKNRIYQREYQRRRRAGIVKPSVNTLTDADIINAAAIRDMIGEQMTIVRTTEADPFVKARCIAYLAAVALRAVETADLEQRITELEKIQGAIR